MDTPLAEKYDDLECHLEYITNKIGDKLKILLDDNEKQREQLVAIQNLLGLND